jgi:hypothetical protein
MVKQTGRLGAVVVIVVAAWAAVLAQSGPGSGSGLTAKDRAEIQDLVAKYARALGGCSAEDYADVFAPGGYFFSTIRGEVLGRDRLMAMVKSERQCNPPAAPAGGAPATPAPNANAAPRPVPVVVIEPSPEGAMGKADLGGAGGYEDLYVKTSAGWRIKARSVITPREAAAKLTAQDFVEIRRLAGNDHGQFEDVYVDTPAGRRFRSSGVAMSLVPEGVKGTAILKNDGGRYEDVYVRTPHGWRFQSRAYVAESK